jgi:Ohr subfamily peroxiredoxin
MLMAKGREIMIYLSRNAKAIGGREGQVSTPNKSIDLKLSKPVEMGGSNNNYTNPEELFISGYITCLASSFEFLAGQKKVSYDHLEVNGHIDLQDHPTEGGFQFALQVHFKIEGMDDTLKSELVKQTLLFCPFSRAIKGNVDVKVDIA